MKTLRGLVLTFTAFAVIFAAGGLHAASKTSENKSDTLFQALDKDKDGKISKEEWDAADVNQDGEITPEEWKRFQLKSTRAVKWIDANSDGYMDKREFQKNFGK